MRDAKPGEFFFFHIHSLPVHPRFMVFKFNKTISFLENYLIYYFVVAGQAPAPAPRFFSSGSCLSLFFSSDSGSKGPKKMRARLTRFGSLLLIVKFCEIFFPPQTT